MGRCDRETERASRLHRIDDLRRSQLEMLVLDSSLSSSKGPAVSHQSEWISPDR